MLQQKIKQLSEQYFNEIVAIRRYLHAHPELSFCEEKTAQYIQLKLDEIGVAYTANFAGHGVVVKIEGKNPHLKTIALRADIDALPIVEANDIAYKSQNHGVMHACGHDAHTANLLGVVKILNLLKNDFEGTVKCIFQPAEEKIPGGASLMIKQGVLKNPEPTIIIGQHVYPPLDAGKVGFASGKYMASADEIYITVHGKGGHAADPRNFIDPILMTAQIVVALQQVVSRLAPPQTPTVLSFGKINSQGGYNNIIPNSVKLEGTFRTMEEEWRYQAHQHIQRIAQATAHAHGGSAEVDILIGYPHLINEPQLTERCQKNAIEFLGENQVENLPIRMTAEDFAYYGQEIPACFYRLGIRNQENGITSGLHTPTFNIDENALLTGVGLMTWLAICELNN